jgi:hypothetical protein
VRGLRAVAWPLACIVLLAGCGSADPGPRRRVSQATAAGAIPARLRQQARPIGRSQRFHPPARGPVLGRCGPQLGARDEVHLELFAADRVALVPAAIGTRPPRRESDGQVTSARCYGELVTLDPTGVIRFRPGTRLTVADVFRSWGEPLAARRLLSFNGTVTAYVDGHRWTRTPPAAIPLTQHAEIVLEVGPHVPPHTGYRFPTGS